MNSKELENRIRSFAYRVVKLCEALPKRRISFIIENQLLRSSFSAAANYRAATKGISKKAFISKLSIAFEEMDESQFWLENILELNLIPSDRLSPLLQESLELSSILGSARKTSQATINKLSH